MFKFNVESRITEKIETVECHSIIRVGTTQENGVSAVKIEESYKFQIQLKENIT